MKQIILFFFTCTCTYYTTFSQSILPEFGEFSHQERNMTSCTFDKDAPVVVIFDEGQAYHNFQNNFTTYRRVRLKILKEAGLNAANVEIPYFSWNNYEFVNEVEAVLSTPNEEGIYIQSKVNSKDIIRYAVNERTSILKIPFPNVKPGSILEYKYTSTVKSFNGSAEWYFQSKYPALSSQYRLHYAKTGLFTYQLFKKSSIAVIEKDDQISTNYFFEIKDLPGLKLEPYMDAPRDCLQRIQFQLGNFRDFFQKTYDLPNDWDEFSESYLKYKDLDKQLTKQIKGSQEFAKKINSNTTDEQKIKLVYEFIQNEFYIEEAATKFIRQSLAEVWEKKSGTPTELNMLIVYLLGRMGIKTTPVLTASRSYGLISPKQLFMEQFNKLVVLAETGANRFILDVSAKHFPIRLIPIEVFGNYGLLVKKEASSFIRLQSELNYYYDNYTTSTSLNEDLKVYSQINHQAKSLSSIEQKISSIQTNKKIDTEDSSGTSKEISFVFLDSGIGSTVKKVLKTDFAQLSGEYISIFPFQKTQFASNPFVSDSRFSNINFSAKRVVNITDTIQYPSSFSLVTEPSEKSYVSGDSSIILTKKILISNNKVLGTLTLYINRIVYTPEEYDEIKRAFIKIQQWLNEPIVFKKNTK